MALQQRVIDTFLVRELFRLIACFSFVSDFGLFKGTKIGFDDLWGNSEAISEVGMEKRLNKDGLRFRMNRTEKEAAEVGPMYDLPGFNVNLPIIGETYLGPPKVADIWEAMGFTATSNNEARQAEKMKAIEKARTATKGVLGGPGAELRAKWLEKYGYPRLVGTGGIFYADQLSTDKQPMGGFVSKNKLCYGNVTTQWHMLIFFLFIAEHGKEWFYLASPQSRCRRPIRRHDGLGHEKEGTSC